MLQKEFDHFVFIFGHSSVTFSGASVTFFVTFLPDSFCRTPLFFLWQGEKQEVGRISFCAATRLTTTCHVSEQLPCRSAEVKFFSVFLCQRCREIWREILVKFSALRFPGFGCAAENFTKISRQKTAWKTEKFTQISLCRGAVLTCVVAFPPPDIKFIQRARACTGARDFTVDQRSTGGGADSSPVNQCCQSWAVQLPKPLYYPKSKLQLPMSGLPTPRAVKELYWNMSRIVCRISCGHFPWKLKAKNL